MCVFGGINVTIFMYLNELKAVLYYQRETYVKLKAIFVVIDLFIVICF